jgi:hypothetical protein
MTMPWRRPAAAANTPGRIRSPSPARTGRRGCRRRRGCRTSKAMNVATEGRSPAVTMNVPSSDNAIVHLLDEAGRCSRSCRRRVDVGLESLVGDSPEEVSAPEDLPACAPRQPNAWVGPLSSAARPGCGAASARPAAPEPPADGGVGPRTAANGSAREDGLVAPESRHLPPQAPAHRRLVPDTSISTARAKRDQRPRSRRAHAQPAHDRGGDGVQLRPCRQTNVMLRSGPGTGKPAEPRQRAAGRRRAPITSRGRLGSPPWVAVVGVHRWK